MCHTIFRVPTLLVALTCLCGCSLFGEDVTDIKIVGRVTSAVGGTPIESATIKLVKVGLTDGELLARTTSDSEGRYLLEHSESGFCPDLLFYLTVYTEGYKSLTFLQTVSGTTESSRTVYTGVSYVRCQSEPQTIDAALIPLGS